MIGVYNKYLNSPICLITNITLLYYKQIFMIEPIREYILSLDGDKDDFQDIFNDIGDNDVSKSTIFPDISIYRLYLN